MNSYLRINANKHMFFKNTCFLNKKNKLNKQKKIHCTFLSNSKRNSYWMKIQFSHCHLTLGLCNVISSESKTSS